MTVPIYLMLDTWNAVGTTFNSIYMNISNGAGGAPVGAAASRAFRLDANGTKIFDVDISGGVTAASGITAATGTIAGRDIQVTGSRFLYWNGLTQLTTAVDGNLVVQDSGGATFGRLQLGGTTNLFGSVARDTAGIKFVRADNSIGTWSKDGVMTIASLPTPASAGVGANLFVTDALGPVFGVTVGAGGAANVPVYSDGTNWVVG